LATGPTVVPDTPTKREVLLNLLERARQNSAMHAPGMAPFNLKVSFNSTGKDSRNSGYGEVEETWLNGQTWRWTARLGDYSQFLSGSRPRQQAARAYSASHPDGAQRGLLACRR